MGLSYTNREIDDCLKEILGIHYEIYDDETLISFIADKLYRNKIVGVLRGRTEIGPRALGHRSILANPMWQGMKDYLNSKVKHREDFRPFAPIVIEEEQFHVFDLVQHSPYMLLATTVKEKYRNQIPSVVHIDDTARIQSVSKSTDLFMHKLLLQFSKLTGVPILLNTSFNVANEPIVESPMDAITTFLKTEIDYLIIENYIITKGEK